MDTFLLVLGIITLILVVLLILFPSILTFRYFLQTSSMDYIFISAMYISFAIGLVFLYIYNVTLDLISIKLAGIFAIITFYFIFMHVTRFRWEKNPKFLTGFSFSWITILIIVFLISPNHVFLSLMMIGFDLLRIWVFSIMLYAYLSVTPIQVSSLRIKRIRIIFCIIGISQIVAGMFLVISRLSMIDVAKEYLFLPSIEISVLRNLMESTVHMTAADVIESIITVILLTFLVVRYPEAFFISRPQILRAMTLYRNVSAKTDDRMINKNLLHYLENIPPEIFD